MQFTELKWAFDPTVNVKVDFIEKVNRNLHLNPKSDRNVTEKCIC